MLLQRVCRALPAIALLCLDLLIVLSLSGCLSARPRPQIALITPIATSELWKSMHAGAYRATQANNVHLYWNGATENGDVERQIEIFEHKTSQQVMGIVLVPTHASALISAVADAQRLRVPVILAGAHLASSAGPGVVAVVNDEVRTGELAAQTMAKLVPVGEIAIVGADPSNSGNWERVKAFEKAMERVPSVQIVEKFYTGTNTFAGADGDPAALLTRHPNLQGIFAPSLDGTRTAYGMLRGNTGPRVHLVACEQEADQYEPLRRGEIDAVIAIDTYQIGYRATHQLLEHVTSGALLKEEVVEPILVTWNNVRDPALQRRLRPYAGYDK